LGKVFGPRPTAKLTDRCPSESSELSADVLGGCSVERFGVVFAIVVNIKARLNAAISEIFHGRC
jgi:hypothetical protein